MQTGGRQDVQSLAMGRYHGNTGKVSKLPRLLQGLEQFPRLLAKIDNQQSTPFAIGLRHIRQATLHQLADANPLARLAG